MKKKIIFLACLLALVSLAGCTRHKKNEELMLSFPEASAVFNGTVTDKIRTGTVTGDGWSFEGTLTEDRLLDGTAENLPCSAAVGGIASEGVYSGSLVSGAPDGEGVFTFPSGAVFSGEFSGGVAAKGEAENLPWSCTHGGIQYTGIYSGTLVSGQPEGTGSFDGESAALLRFAWSGGWSGGAPSGNGTLTDDRCVISVEGAELAGAYSGEGSDGKPDGSGTFSGADAEDISFTYSGEWKDGLMDGQGVLRYESSFRYVREGTFTDGCFTPTLLETIVSMGTCDPSFTLTEAQLAFLSEYPDLWERADHQSFFDSPYTSLVNHQAYIGKCFSEDDYSESPYWMEIYSMGIVTARTASFVVGGKEMTAIFAYDSSYIYPCLVLVPGSVDRLYVGNSFHIFAVPLTLSTYVNTLGGQTTCLVLLAGDIYTGM